LIAECALRPGDCVITIGTGSFISVNVGSIPIASNNGAYPLANFKYKDKEIYVLHSPVSSSGIAIDWAKYIGITFKSILYQYYIFFYFINKKVYLMNMMK
jgi:glycerol kinase